MYIFLYTYEHVCILHLKGIRNKASFLIQVISGTIYLTYSINQPEFQRTATPYAQMQMNKTWNAELDYWMIELLPMWEREMYWCWNVHHFHAAALDRPENHSLRHFSSSFSCDRWRSEKIPKPSFCVSSKGEFDSRDAWRENSFVSSRILSLAESSVAVVILRNRTLAAKLYSESTAGSHINFPFIFFCFCSVLFFFSEYELTELEPGYELSDRRCRSFRLKH